jgi:hypothetical protein
MLEDYGYNLITTYDKKSNDPKAIDNTSSSRKKNLKKRKCKKM